MNYGIILASGIGSRYGSEIPKQFVKIGNKTIFEHTIGAFEEAAGIDKIVLVVTPDYRNLAEEILAKNNYKKVVKLLNGGEIRKESSFIGISSIEENDANVLIHDCARPLVSQRIIADCVEALKTHSAVDVAIPASDTVLKVKDNIIQEIPKRASLMCSQTPQCFRLELIKKAHQISKDDKNFTDDCGLIVKYNLAPVYIVQGEVENFKITYPNDIYLAEKLLMNR